MSCTISDTHLSMIRDDLRITKVGAAAPVELPGEFDYSIKLSYCLAILIIQLIS